MATVNFIGSSTITNATNFAVMDDVDVVFSSTSYVGFIASISMWNELSANNQHYLTMQTSATGGNTVNVNAILLSGEGDADILKIEGLNLPVEILGNTPFSAESSQNLRNALDVALGGNDVFNLSGVLSSFWGDYAAAPSGGMVIMGNDSFKLGAGISLASGFGSVVIYGDAQTVGAGRSATGGNDTINIMQSSIGLTAYGDFQTVAGTVVYGNDSIFGSSQSDTIYGDGLSSTVDGGKDYLFGGLGADILIGGGGNDTLIGDGGGDLINGGEGFDYADFGLHVDFDSSALVVDLENNANNSNIATNDTLLNIEGLSGRNSSFYIDDLRGNGVANTLRGLDGNDILSGRGGDDKLYGGLGNDALSGSTGADRFYFETTLDDETVLTADTNIDTISTVSSLDKVVLDNDIFTALGTSFSSDEFRAINTGTAFTPVDSSDNIIYLKSVGELYYDRDGNGGTYTPILFAELTPGASLGFSQFAMIE